MRVSDKMISSFVVKRNQASKEAYFEAIGRASQETKKSRARRKIPQEQCVFSSTTDSSTISTPIMRTSSTSTCP